MNAIFKVIWNISLNVWVAVGEFAKGKQKSKTTCAIPPSQHTSAVINKFSFPRLGFLAIAIIGVLGGQNAYAIDAQGCTDLGSSCVTVSTDAELRSALTSGTATTILMLNDITLASNISVNQGTSNRKDLVIDGGGFKLNTGGAQFIFTNQTNVSWGGTAGSFTLSNLAELNSATGNDNTVFSMDGGNSAINIIVNNIGTMTNSMLAVLGVMGSGGAPNLNSQLVFGNFTDPLSLTFGTNHQLAQASNIKFTGHFDLTATTGAYPAVFWTNAADANSRMYFSSTANVSISTPLFASGPGAYGNYQYTLEDGAQFALNSDQNVFGSVNGGLLIGTYSAGVFGSGAVLQLANTAGTAYSTGNAITNGGNTNAMGNGVTQNGDVIYNLAAGSKLAVSGANSIGILATKTGPTNSGGIYISSGAAINAAGIGISASHGGSAPIVLENKNSGVITATTGISATNTGSGSTDVTNHGVITAATGMSVTNTGTGTANVINDGTINSTSAGIAIASGVGTSTVDNTRGSINASAGTAINIANGTLLNLLGGNITTTNAATGLNFIGSSGSHTLTDLIFNLNGTGSAFAKAAGVNLELRHVIFNTANGTVLNDLSGLTFASSTEGRNTINVSGTGTGIAATNTALSALDAEALDINVSGAGVGINATGGSALDFTDSNLTITVTGTEGTALQIADGSGETTIGADTQIDATAATAINFLGSSSKTLNNNGTLKGSVIFAGVAGHTINNNGTLDGTLTTGTGNDTLVLGSASKSNDVINLGGGDNNVTIQNGALVSSIITGNGDDTFTINGMSVGSTYLGSLDAGSGLNTLNFNASTDELAAATSLQGFTNINLADSHITLVSDDNIGSGTVNIDSNSELLFGSTFDGILNATLGSGTGSAIVNNSANVSLSQASVFAGTWQVNNGGALTASSGNQLGSASVELDGTLNLDDIALFDHVLTGNGTLNVVKNLASTAFDFGSTVGGAFSGIVNLTNTTFALSADNAAALASATLKLSNDSVTTVGTTDRTLHGLDLNGGMLIFDGAVPQSQDNGIVTVTDLALNSGTVSITGSGSWDNTDPLATNVSILEQDRGGTMLELINAANVTGDIDALNLLVNGTAITSGTQGVESAIQQGGSTVANAIHNYGLTSSNGNGGSGLYVNYTLSALELLVDGANALLLATESGLTANRILNAELFGVGGLVVDAQNGALTLANGNNSYEGTTTVNFGELILGANGAFGQTSLLDIASGASANINGYNQTVGAVTNTGTVTLGSGGVLTSGLLTNSGAIDLTGGALNLSAGGTSTVAGGLTGAGALNINGGNLAVSAANSGLSGQTHIADVASATLTGTGTLGTSAVEVLGTLNLNGANAAMTNVLSGGGVINTNAAVTLSGNNSFSGAHQIGANGALTVGQANNLGASSATVNLGTLTSHLVLNGVSESIANVLSGVVGSTVDIIGGADTALTANNSGFLGQYALAGSSKLTVSSTNNLGASSSVALAGAGDTLSLSGFNGTFGNSVTGNGVLQVTDDAEVTLTSSNGVGSAVTIDIADATLNLDDIALFNHALTGNGLLNVAKNDASTAFDFGTTVGGAFTGTVNLNNATFDLSGNNTTALAQATLKLSSGNLTSVGNGVQNIGALAMNGGTLLFNDIVDNSGIITSDGTIAANSIDTTGGGEVRVNLPNNLAPSLDGLSVMELDEGEIIVTLATGTATGTGHELMLTDENGDPINAITYQGIHNAGSASPAATGSFNYGMTTGEGYDGLYVNYGLTALELLSSGSDALVLTATLANNGTQSNDLSAQITGSGDLAFASANDGSTASLSNSTNSYTGTTWVSSGNLRLDADSALGQTSLLAMSTATHVDLNGTQQVVGELATEGGSTLDLNDGKLTVTGGGQIDGALTGGGELVLSGGLLNVSYGNAGFTGSTDIANGAVAHLSQAQGLGNGTINNNGTLHLDNTIGTLFNALTGSDGEVLLSNNASVQVAGDNSGYSGLFTNQAGSILIANSAEHLGGSSIANSGALILDTGSVWDLTNAISGTGTLVKRGSGTVKIEGDTVSADLTTIEEGLLQLGNSAVTHLLSVEESLQEDALLVSVASNMANLTSNVLITANGSLGGYGQVTGNVENHGDLIMPNALTGGDFGTFTIDGNYTGDEGMITFNTILAGDTSVTDRLVITGNTAGQSYVTVNNIGGVGARTFEGIKIIDVGGDSAGQFTLNGRAVGGAYEYFLYQGGASTPDDGNWYLRTQADDRRPEPASYTANLAAANNMFVTSLADRMGETLYTDVFTGEQKTTSLWLRNEGSHNRSRDDSGELQTQDNRYVMQLGGDVAQWSRNAQDLWRVGVMAGYANSSSSTVAQVAGYRSTGSVDGYSVGIYGSWLADNTDDTGVYVDSWVQYSWFDNRVSGQDLATEKYDSKGFTASVEGGYAFKVGESVNQSYFIQPKAQMVWMGVKADDHTETNGTVISGDGNGNIQTRLGAKAFINPSDKAKASGPAFKPFVEANWIHNTKDFGTTLDGVTVKQAGTANIAELKLGVDGQINNQLNLWGNIGQQVGNKGYSETSVVLGVKYNF
nr:autotransporter outer membrane beta-barrel domain-containing protein [Yersinia similis]